MGCAVFPGCWVRVLRLFDRRQMCKVTGEKRQREKKKHKQKSEKQEREKVGGEGFVMQDGAMHKVSCNECLRMRVKQQTSISYTHNMSHA